MNIFPSSFNSEIFNHDPISGTSWTQGNIESNIFALKDKGDVMVIDLSDDHLEAFDSINESIKDIDVKEYPKISKLVDETFSKYEGKSGTVAGFFKRCFKDPKVGCSFECAREGAKSDKNTCDDLILAVESGKFVKLNSDKRVTSHVFIYMKEKTLLPENLIIVLREMRVQTYTLVYSDGSERKMSVNDVESSGSMGLFLLLIFFLILIGVAIWMYMNGGTSLPWN